MPRSAATGSSRATDADVGQVPAPAGVAELLGVDEGTMVLARQRQMYASGEPVQMATSYIPLDIAEGTPIAEQDTGPGGIYSRFAELGHDPVAFAETVRIRRPTDDEARFLGMDLDQRVIAIRRTAATADGPRRRGQRDRDARPSVGAGLRVACRVGAVISCPSP